jgi:uncharacterized protein YbaP (TraB family)
MRPNYCITAICVILFHFSALAQQKTASPNSLLWQVTGKNLDKPSYIFGTIHLICRPDFLWTEAMKNSLAKSDKVCFEMDLDDPAMSMQIATALIDNNGKKLKDYFTADEYKLLKKYMKDSLGMSIELFEKMKPIALGTIMSTSDAACPDQTSYEDSIMKLAQEAGKEIIGIETVPEQLAALESLPIDSVLKEIRETISNKKSTDTKYIKMLEAYKKQDIAALYGIITAGDVTVAELAALLEDRNIKWIPRMKQKMGQGSIFFAVGAGHLWGTNGIIGLLRKEGYTITPLN